MLLPFKRGTRWKIVSAPSTVYIDMNGTEQFAYQVKSPAPEITAAHYHAIVLLRLVPILTIDTVVKAIIPRQGIMTLFVR